MLNLENHVLFPPILIFILLVLFQNFSAYCTVTFIWMRKASIARFIFSRQKCIFSSLGFEEGKGGSEVLNCLLVVGFVLVFFPVRVGFGRNYDIFHFFSLKIEQWSFFVIWRCRRISDAVFHYFWKIVLLSRLLWAFVPCFSFSLQARSIKTKKWRHWE